MRGLIYLFVLAVVLSSCTPKTVVVKEPAPVPDPPPAWVTGRPISSIYYIGIGVASKRAHPLEFARVAKKNALGDLSSEISTTVSSNSILYQLEDSDSFREDYENTVQLQSTEQLEGYETVGSWEDDSEYWIYYRLSKADYEAARQRKIDLAVNKGLDFYTRGRDQERSNNMAAALNSYVKGLEAIKEHFSEQLEVTYEGQQEYLGNALFARISEVMTNLRLQPLKPEVQVKLGDALNRGQVGFTLTTANGAPVADVPVMYQLMPNRRPPKTFTITDPNGIALAKLEKVRTADSPREVRALVNLESIVNRSKTVDPIIAKMLDRFSGPVTQAYLVVERPSIWITSNESELGQASAAARLQKAFSKAATDHGFAQSSARDGADFVVEIQAETRQGGTSFDMFAAFLDGSVVIRSGTTGGVIYQENLSEIKGVQLDYPRASEKAYQKASGLIQDKIFPQFHRQFLK